MATFIPPARTVMVGYGKMLLNTMNPYLPPGSVVVVEDPDIIVKRDVHNDFAALPCVGSVVAARYHRGEDYVEAVEAHLGDAPVEMVLPGLEYGVRGAATLAQRWGLPGATAAAADRLTDKLRLREAANAGGLRNPEWTEVFGPGDVRAFADGEPVVLKPANRHASLGVQILPAGADIDAAWATTVAAQDSLMLPDIDLDWRYAAERVVTGHEYSVEVLVQRGAIVFRNVTDKLTMPGRHPVELGHVLPAPIPADLLAAFDDAMASLVKAIGFSDGVLHAEWIADADGPVLIECAGRVPGDSIVTLIDVAYGGDLVKAMVSVLSGREPALPTGAPMGAAIRFLTVEPGTVDRVDGLAAAQAAFGVLRAGVTVGPGDTVAPTRSSWDRVGDVVATGADATAARAAAWAAAETITVVTTGAES
ncbi:hypothetical protein [Alloactinosynnema sp. L-07]|uniref:ATP-grasp domain-containing protein n=1 Tax=Alloactinosynnema sp. L-07 TaxID=1653480 RepID=UPI00065F0A03|nr:ATP-grasp domain-containing protein [Alloactinosynnema sp. L-07]CRK56703.1 hypothetical protein [Alloactinosynnema sp. L-07]